MPTLQRQVYVEFDTSNQTADMLQKTLAHILHVLGCGGCGRVAAMTIPVGDPEIPLNLRQAGVKVIKDELTDMVVTAVGRTAAGEA